MRLLMTYIFFLYFVEQNIKAIKEYANVPRKHKFEFPSHDPVVFPCAYHALLGLLEMESDIKTD